MTLASYQHQMKSDAAGGAPAGAVRRITPVAVYDGQGRAHGRSVGGHAPVQSGSADCLTTSLNSRGRIAICATRSSQFTFAHRVSSHGCCDRRRAGTTPLSYRLVATPIEFVRAVMAARRQFKTSPHKFARQSTESLGLHLERLSSVRGSDTWNHSERRNGRVPNSSPELPKERGELPNVA